MDSVIKYSIFAFGLVSSITVIGQVVDTSKASSGLKDTVYLGISNKVKLGGKTLNPTSVHSNDAHVSIKGNELTIQPVKAGDIPVNLVYDDSTISRNFISTFLPMASDLHFCYYDQFVSKFEYLISFVTRLISK